MKTAKEFMHDKEVTKRWTQLCSSLGITDEQVTELVAKIEEMQQFVLSLPISMESTNCDHIIIPIIVRAYKKHGYLIQSCRAAYQFVSKNYSLFKTFSTEMKQIPGIDMEAQFIELQASEIARLKL
jgi:hypothetical protein